MYAVVDIETTGGRPGFDKITEIAVYIFDGVQIIDEFVSLINPEREIPYFITKLTGITNEMVSSAPRFFEIAKRIVEIIEGKIFVAHNSAFDYNFIREEFKSLGYTFFCQQIDTVKLSRKLIPARRSYSLGNLCAELSISITDRHRASGDALATVELLKILLQKSDLSDSLLSSITDISTKNIHPDFDLKIISGLIEDPGVYYLHNDKGDIIYIGKSNNVQQRIKSHFQNKSSKKALEMVNHTVSISVEPTGNELIALLLESSEIKKHKPIYNRAQRRSMSHWGIFTYENDFGYLCLEIKSTKGNQTVPVTCFNNKNEAENIVNTLVSKFNLCQKLSGVYPYSGACFYHETGDCNGACIQKEPVSVYNRRAENAVQYFSYSHQNFIIIVSGRTAREFGFVKIANNKYQGFGFFDKTETLQTPDDFLQYIQHQEDNSEIQRIISSYLRKKNVHRIITY